MNNIKNPFNEFEQAPNLFIETVQPKLVTRWSLKSHRQKELIKKYIFKNPDLYDLEIQEHAEGINFISYNKILLKLLVFENRGENEHFQDWICFDLSILENGLKSKLDKLGFNFSKLRHETADHGKIYYATRELRHIPIDKAYTGFVKILADLHKKRRYMFQH